MTTPTTEDLTALRVEALELLGVNPYRWRYHYQHENGWGTSELYESLEEAESDWKDDGGPTHADPIERVLCAPDPTLLIADAMQLVEALKAEGWRLILRNPNDEWIAVFVHDEKDGFSEARSPLDNPALAITRAFLAVRKGR